MIETKFGRYLMTINLFQSLIVIVTVTKHYKKKTI